ncbi:uncharacterized protein [Musca autumnalis]|uniref:uncharacterized protein n=1 Tax=Musca autumnalis TaxID=221902 RepID=UPI003CED4117
MSFFRSARKTPIAFMFSLTQAGSGIIKNDLSEMATNFKALGLTKLCLANISNDNIVLFKVNVIMDAAVAYIRLSFNDKMSDEQVVDVVNYSLSNSIFFERGIDKRCANVTDTLVGQKRPPVPAATNIATLGRIFFTIGTNLDCLIRKPTPNFPQLVQGLRTGLQGIANDNDPSRTSADIFITHLTVLSESLEQLAGNCF